MSPFAFLLVAAVLIVVGLVVVLIRNHQPRRDHAIDEFQKEMRALSPESRRATDHRLRPMPPERGGTGE